MKFLFALNFMKQGQKVCRLSWGKRSIELLDNRFLLDDESKFLLVDEEDESRIEWKASAEDIFANDWETIQESIC